MWLTGWNAVLAAGKPGFKSPFIYEAHWVIFASQSWSGDTGQENLVCFWPSWRIKKMINLKTVLSLQMEDNSDFHSSPTPIRSALFFSLAWTFWRSIQAGGWEETKRCIKISLQRTPAWQSWLGFSGNRGTINLINNLYYYHSVSHYVGLFSKLKRLQCRIREVNSIKKMTSLWSLNVIVTLLRTWCQELKVILSLSACRIPITGSDLNTILLSLLLKVYLLHRGSQWWLCDIVICAIITISPLPCAVSAETNLFSFDLFKNNSCLCGKRRKISPHGMETWKQSCVWVCCCCCCFTRSGLHFYFLNIRGSSKRYLQVTLW